MDGLRLDALKAKLRAREGRSEFKQNCEVIRAEIAKLEARRDSQSAKEGN